MSEAFEIDVEPLEGRGGGPAFRVRLRVTDPGLGERVAVLKVLRVFSVPSLPFVSSHSEVLAEERVPLSQQEGVVEVGPLAEDLYTYSGRFAAIQVVLRVGIEGWTVTRKVTSQEVVLPLFDVARPVEEGGTLLRPKDEWNLARNLSALPRGRQVVAVGTLLVGVPATLLWPVVCVHEGLVPVEAAWLHANPEFNLVKGVVWGLLGAPLLGLFTLAAIRKALQGYAELEVVPPGRPIGRHARPSLAELVRGRSRVPLEGARIRLVAYNLEKGTLGRGESIHPARKDNPPAEGLWIPVNVVELVALDLPPLPADAELSEFWDHPVDFGPVFERLHPPQHHGDQVGVAIGLRAQLLHDDLWDVEAEASGPLFVWEDFLAAGGGTSLPPPPEDEAAGKCESPESAAVEEG